DLGAADDDRMLAAEILRDRRRQPRRGDVEFDRAAGETQPQPDGREHDDGGERRRGEEQPAYPAMHKEVMNRTSNKAALLPHGGWQRAMQPPEGGRGVWAFTPVVVRDACHAPQVCSIQTAYAPSTPSARAGPSAGNGLR